MSYTDIVLKSEQLTDILEDLRQRIIASYQTLEEYNDLTFTSFDNLTIDTFNEVVNNIANPEFNQADLFVYKQLGEKAFNEVFLNNYFIWLDWIGINDEFYPYLNHVKVLTMDGVVLLQLESNYNHVLQETYVLNPQGRR